MYPIMCILGGSCSKVSALTQLGSLVQVKLEVHDVNDHRLAKELDKQDVLVRIVLKEIWEVTLAHQASLAQ